MLFCNLEMNDSSAKLCVGGGGFLRALLTNQGGVAPQVRYLKFHSLLGVTLPQHHLPHLFYCEYIYL